MNNVMAGLIGGVAAVAVGASAMVFANRSSDEGEAAKPQEVATKTVCSDERVVTKKEWGVNSVVGTVLGGAAGGALGHQIGGGRGKDVATAAGAIGGAYAGNKIAKHNYPDQEVSYRQRCREVPANS